MGGVGDPGYLAIAFVLANAGIHAVLAAAFRLRTNIWFGHLVTYWMRLFFIGSACAWLSLAASAFYPHFILRLVSSAMLVIVALCFIRASLALFGKTPGGRFLMSAAFAAIAAAPLAVIGHLAVAESLFGLVIGVELVMLYHQRKANTENSALMFFGLMGATVILSSLVRATAILIWPEEATLINSGWIMMLSGFSNLAIVILLMAVNQGIQNSLHRQALTDPLTGLMNRRALMQSFRNIANEIKRKPITLGLIICDLDHFKRVNDLYGHDIGDGVLMAFSGVLRRATRSSDIVARFGGEEFVIMLQEAAPETLDLVANRICAETSRHDLRIGEVQVATTVSVGAGLFDGNEPFDKAFARIDAALYEAKNTGRNKVVIAADGPAVVS